MVIDLGFGIQATQFHCRLYGINAPELAKPGGKESRDYLRSLLPVGAQVLVYSHDWDKYGGRFDGVIYYQGAPATINDQMVTSGHAVRMP